MMNEQALKERLKKIATDSHRTFQEVWKQLLLERILVRISNSAFNQQFIFKGGLLLSHYFPIGRETRDIDFLNRSSIPDQEKIRTSFEKIFSLSGSDGFIFSLSKITILQQPHMVHSGFRLKILVMFGSISDHVFIDLGTGDDVKPIQEEINLIHYKNTPLFEDKIVVCAYSIEAIFADKLDSIVSRGDSNSRMKDFHDLLLLCRNGHLLNLKKIQSSVENVFKIREKPFKIPVRFSSDSYKKMQPIWSKYQKGLGHSAEDFDLPDNLSDLISEINQWLKVNWKM